MTESKYTWHAGWYATKLHAVYRQDNARPLPHTQDRALCGAFVYVHPDGPPTEYAKRRLAMGKADKCKRCLRQLEAHDD